MKTFNVKLLYLYKFISQCLPIYAFYTILFIEKGMTVSDIAVLIALWSIFTIVFEVPSGVLADRWNRKYMLAAAAVMQGLCFMIWFFSRSFLMFAGGFVFWAAAAAFTSGTEEGLIFDNLKSDGREEEFAGIYGRARFFGNIGTIAGIVSAGMMAGSVSTGTMALISAAICFINVVLILQIREKNFYSEHPKEELPGFFGTFKEAFAFAGGNGIVLISIVYLVFFAGLGNYLDEFDAMIIHDFELGNTWVSVILTVRFVFNALGDILVPVVQKKIVSIRQVFLLGGLACCLLAAFSFFWTPNAFLILGLALMFLTITEILLVNALQHEIKEEGRATVMSFYGVGQSVAMVCFCLVYAVLTGLFDLQQVYLMIALYGIAGSFCFFWLN